MLYSGHVYSTERWKQLLGPVVALYLFESCAPVSSLSYSPSGDATLPRLANLAQLPLQFIWSYVIMSKYLSRGR